MQMQQNSGSWRTAPILVAGLALLCFCGLAATLIACSIRAANLSSEIQQAQRLILAAERLKFEVRQVEAYQRHFLIVGDPESLDHYRNAVRDSSARFTRLRTLAAEIGLGDDRVAAIGRLIETRLGGLERSAAERQAGHRRAALAAVRPVAGVQLTEGIRFNLEWLQSETQTRARQLAAERAMKSLVAQIATFALTALGGAGLALLCVLARRSFSSGGMRARPEVAAQER